MRNVHRFRPPLAHVLAAGAALALLLGLVIAADLALTLHRFRPAIAALATANPDETVYMHRFGAGGVSPSGWVELDDVAPAATCAVLGAEDVRFFEHGTIAWDAQRRMFARMLHGNFSAGASSIAQQLARNLFLGPDRTLRRKAREYVLAYELSHVLSKERQLEVYLNVVEWGPGVWGIDAASRYWFGKPPAALTPVEATLLATLLPAPRRGLQYAASAPARLAHVRIVDALWGGTLLDDVGRRGLAARIRRWADHVMAGSEPMRARSLLELEMGSEYLGEPSSAIRLRSAGGCDPLLRFRRGRNRDG
jgi:monofunctional biosynthetic peptidoglycan transglycosylase